MCIAPLTVVLTFAVFLLGCGRSNPVDPHSVSLPDVLAGQVVITLAAGASPDSVVADRGGTILEWEDEEQFATLSPPPGLSVSAYIARLLADPRVVTAEPNESLEDAESRQQSFAFDDGFGSPTTYREQSASRTIGLDEAQAVSLGAGVRIAILDTGADLTHPALAGHIVGGVDFVQGDASPAEETNGLDDDGDGRIDEAFGHGTHVAGLVALVAPQADLLIVRVLDADGRGDITNVAAGLRWAVNNGAQVINLSLGMLRSSDAIQDAMDDAEGQGVLVIASAGNWGAESPQEYPARSSHASAIAACDSLRTPASFTSFAGYVRLSGPGVGVRSAYPGGQYRLWSGTSMSAPLVSGTAALLIAQHPTWNDQEVLRQMQDRSRPMTGVSAAQMGKLGAGALHAGDAVTLGPLNAQAHASHRP